MVIVILAILFVVLCIVGIKWLGDQISDLSSDFSWEYEDPKRHVGRLGEEEATGIIRSVLKEDDRLFTNVQVDYQGKPAELDNVIVNKYGVFVIEVKNYIGRLTGEEDDYEWVKYHVSDAGNIYSKLVKNPIKQVKRQVYVLANFLKYYGTVRVWVEGYALLLHKNSPVASEYVLSSVQDIDRAIHTSTRNHLTKKEIEEITRLLS